MLSIFYTLITLKSKMSFLFCSKYSYGSIFSLGTLSFLSFNLSCTFNSFVHV